MIVRHLLALVLIATSFWFGVERALTASAATGIVVADASIPMFPTEDVAQAHCPRGTIVWLNTRTGISHERGMRWYGRTMQGAFVCRREATAEGYRDTGNGQ